MEEILEELKEKAEQAVEYAKKLGKKTVDKTNTVVSQTKLKLAVSKSRDKITDVYAEMGEKLYESHVNGTELPDFTELYEAVETLKKEIDDINEQIEEISNTVKCASCGASNSSDNVYCGQCGEKL